MKTYPTFIHTLAVACMGCLLFSTALAQQIKVDKNNRTIDVTATDSATAMADTALVHIGYQVYGPDSDTAYAHASQVSNAISKTLSNAGVAKGDMESDEQNIAETQPYELEKLPPTEQTKRKFRVQQSWTVKTKAKDAAKILNFAINAGANQSGQIDWAMADDKALEAQAAGNALVRARAIAEQMASGLGVKLGDLVYASNVAEQRNILPEPVGRMQMSMAAAPATKPLSISPRKVSKSATVTAIFAIE